MTGEGASAGTRNRILDGALALVAEQGLSALTNRNLAQRAEVSLGSLTYHFASQEDLLREALLRFVEREAARLLEISERLREADPARSAAEVQELLSRETASRLAKLELYLYAARHPALQGAARKCFDAYDGVVEAAIRALGLPATSGLAATAVAVIDGLQIRRLATGDEEQLPAAEALMTLLRGAQS